MFDIIAFDADDTLWQNETLYVETQDKLKRIIACYGNAETTESVLFQTETRNIAAYGYGIKSFTLSMIETAIELTKGQIRGDDIREIIKLGKIMLQSPVELLDGVEETVVHLSRTFPIMVITKGDLLDQETKFTRSGLKANITHFEVVSNKTSETYTALLRKHRIAPENFLMVGNSVKSDILPVVAIGGQAIHIPHHLTWAHETIVQKETDDNRKYAEINDIRQLPDWINNLA